MSKISFKNLSIIITKSSLETDYADVLMKLNSKVIENHDLESKLKETLALLKRNESKHKYEVESLKSQL